MTDLLPWLASMLLYALVMSITPGPNNLMLASSGITFGLARTMPHVFGIIVGASAQMLLVAAGLGALIEHTPWVQVALKVAGSLYLLWLAWHMWRMSELRESEARRPLGFWRAAAFQFVNPKAWVVALGFVAGFFVAGPTYWTQALIGTGAFMASALPATVVWAAFGAALRRWLSSPRALRVVSASLALLTALTVVLFWV